MVRYILRYPCTENVLFCDVHFNFILRWLSVICWPLLGRLAIFKHVKRKWQKKDCSALRYWALFLVLNNEIRNMRLLFIITQSDTLPWVCRMSITTELIIWISSVSCDWSLHSLHFFPFLPHRPSLPPPAVATRYTQILLYCCLTEFDTETEPQAGGKKPWASGKLRCLSCCSFPEASVLKKQGFARTEGRGAGSQHLWGLYLPGRVKKSHDISNDLPPRRQLL